MTASLTVDVVAALRGPLSDLGFKKRGGEMFTCDIVDGVLGWLGLNRAYRRVEDQLEVNPVIGIRHQEVERLVAELRGKKFHSYQPPTVSSPLSYLTPVGRYVPWLFARGDAIDEVAGDLVTAVAQHGMPFIRKAKGLRELCQLIQQGQGFPHQLAYRRPVAWLLIGDRDEASSSLEQQLADMRDRTDTAACEFRSFAERLRGLLDGDSL
jgi:hypothetical protein